MKKFDQDNGHKLRRFLEENEGERVWDVEDLVKTLENARHSCCPYFASNRYLTKDSDIFFCPFNYLIGLLFVKRENNFHSRLEILIERKLYYFSNKFRSNNSQIIGSVFEKCNRYIGWGAQCGGQLQRFGFFWVWRERRYSSDGKCWGKM